jgi:hypothetical protein
MNTLILFIFRFNPTLNNIPVALDNDVGLLPYFLFWKQKVSAICI